METALARQQIYSFLAGIFLQEPNLSEWPHQYRALQALVKAGSADAVGKPCGEETAADSFTLPQDSGAVVNNLCQEFYDCFFVPMSGRYVPPYESALLEYNPEKKKGFGHLNSPEAAHVAACYDAVGFRPHELNAFLPLKEIHLADHVGFELAFMAVLCRAEKVAWDKAAAELGQENPTDMEALKWQKLQLQFLSEHPGKWLPNFCQALTNLAPGYYAQAACAANDWVTVDVAELGKRVIKERKTIN